MDKITKTIIKLVRFRYPLVKVNLSAQGDMTIDVPAGHMEEGANDYMRGLQFLAVSQPADLARLERAIEDDIDSEVLSKSLWDHPLLSLAPSYDQPIYLASPKIYEKFGRFGTWTLHEAVTLILGGNPNTFHDDRILGWAESGETTDLLDRYFEVMRLALTYVGGDHGKLSDPVSPSIFLEWADRLDIELPPGLSEAVERYHKDIALGHKIEHRTSLAGDAAQETHALNLSIDESHAVTTKKLSRKAIKELFKEISDDQWRGNFARETSNGLSGCRTTEAKEKPLYDAIKVAQWVGNNRKEVKLSDALNRVREMVEGEKHGGIAPPSAHDPFGLSKNDHVDRTFYACWIHAGSMI